MKKLILICNSEEMISRMLDESLHRAGYQVDLAWSGKECLTKASKLNPQLILLDSDVIHQTSFALCQQLQADRPNNRVLVLASYDDDVSPFQCFVYKPFILKVLQEKIQEILSQQSSVGSKMA